ncbi:CaiB/BaiF CoA-transferase family protein [Paracoccus sp. J55]|uniref:CaiB/BaiF CoA transferase family protein n=1 Tax=Paracoccus sp. J55 TaxID=935849 RepID=UPI0004B4BD28|nr:CaiB/BaiF CoA-transferase family protein [Paracoccus sp. J55]
MLNASESPEMALDGLKVLDLTRLLPGAFATQVLADMGAEVLKIEQPGTGDYNRAFPPIAKEESGSFLLLNRNKRSLTLNLKTEAGKTILRDLVRGADILIEGFRPGVMDRLGLGYEDLRAINPGLVYCAISGYGQTGPWRLRPGHDMNYLAEAGALQLFGKAGEGPIVPGLSIADVGGGSLMATTGILAALWSRAKTGQGQFVDISMHDGAISWLALHGADALFAGIEPRGGERPLIGRAPCYNVYECADGRHVALGAIEEHFWERFCQVFGTPEFIDRQWPEGEEADAQKAALQARFMTRSRDEWVDELGPSDIPFGPVLDIAEALVTDHARARDMLLHVEHPVEGAVPQLGFPIKLSETPASIRSAPPRLGEHTKEVLEGLGYDETQIGTLREAGAI